MVDFATIKLRPTAMSFRESIYGDKEKKGGWKLPEWSPIQVLDEEALAAKEAREKQLYAQRALGKLSKEEPWEDFIFWNRILLTYSYQ